jgi:hypothetical protein
MEKHGRCRGCVRSERLREAVDISQDGVCPTLGKGDRAMAACHDTAMYRESFSPETGENSRILFSGPPTMQVVP